MANQKRGLLAWLWSICARPTTPRWTIVEVEKPVPITDHSDDAAMASLQDHPGVTALLNRLRLQRAVLETRLLATQHKDLNDVYLLQSRISGLGFAELEIRNATKNLEVRRQRPASIQEIEQFEKIRSSIESVRPTNVG